MEAKKRHGLKISTVCSGLQMTDVNALLSAVFIQRWGEAEEGLRALLETAGSVRALRDVSGAGTEAEPGSGHGEVQGC